MIVKLIVVKGQDEGKVHYVRPGAAKILGRSTKTDIPVRDTGASRLHCEVRNDGEKAVVVDMNSKNGTVVNRKKIAGIHALSDGDRIVLGTTVMETRLEGEKERQAAEEPEPEAAPKPTPPSVEPGAAETQPALHPAEEDALPDDLLGSFEAWLGQETAESEKPPEPAATPPAEQAAEPRAETAAEVPELGPGSSLGGCRIDESLGRQGLCYLYRGVQLSMDRPVAIRVLHPRAARNERIAQRFLRAARSSGRLSHSNIVQVYDAGEEQGLTYIVLEQVEGDTVKVLLKRQGRGKPLPLRRSVDIGSQILDALAHAHNGGIVHGHIRSDNIYVTRHGVAKLADFGFSRSLIRPPKRREADTAGMLAEICYSAPEQLAKPASRSPQSDLYSLAVVLYQMLAGRLPFPKGKPSQILESIRQGHCEPLRDSNPSVPEAVDEAIGQALRADPAERPADARAMQEALRQAARGERP